MANNAFNFKGLYDKIAGILKNSAIVTPGEYSPTLNDYVAVYKNVPNSPGSGDSTIAIKEYVSVTDIGTGGGGGGGSMSNFVVSGDGGIVMSKNGGAFGEGPFTIENANTLTIDSSSVPNGLNWEGEYNSGSTYSINDVVYTNVGSPPVYQTWFAIQAVPTGQAPPTTGVSNAYWALLGTQGPQGNQGTAGLPSSTATFGFTTFTASGGTHTNVINTAGTPGTGSNTTGKVIKVNNTNALNELVIVIGSNYSQGWPDNSQVTFINVSAETSAPVKIVGATTPAVVTLNSSDNAQYLRTKNSTCSVVRETGNTYWMFGDLTNIA